jgi:MoaA/NifB/PqqE/SkfB family radical SAM enzyme
MFEAAWVINKFCNMECSYCNAHNVTKQQQIPVDRILRFFNSKGRKWHINIAGGEPFLYPKFNDLLHRLCENHEVSIITNLDTPPVLDFIQTPPKSVRYVMASLHLGQNRRLSVDEFCARIKALNQKGIHTFATQVITPEVFDAFDGVLNEFISKHGLVVAPKCLRGLHAGSVYPAAYTTEQREKFLEWSLLAQQSHNGQLHDMSVDRAFIHGRAPFLGKHCRAGTDFIRIHASGKITRCGDSNTVIGNLLTGELHLKAEPALCDIKDACPYFCYRHSLLTAP